MQRTHIYLCLIYVDVWQKKLTIWKVIILQLKLINFKKNLLEESLRRNGVALIVNKRV